MYYVRKLTRKIVSLIFDITRNNDETFCNCYIILLKYVKKKSSLTMDTDMEQYDIEYNVLK